MSTSEVINKPKSVEKEKLAAPSMYVVILHNDPITPRTFVVMALKKCFQKIDGEAKAIMQTAHETGSAVVGNFTREIAESKAAKANDFAVENGYFLLFTAEKQ